MSRLVVVDRRGRGRSLTFTRQQFHPFWGWFVLFLVLSRKSSDLRVLPGMGPVVRDELLRPRPIQVFSSGISATVAEVQRSEKWADLFCSGENPPKHPTPYPWRSWPTLRASLFACTSTHTASPHIGDSGRCARGPAGRGQDDVPNHTFFPTIQKILIPCLHF